jgi:hypothetical protein
VHEHPGNIRSRYFVRLSQLLCDKYDSICQRLDKDSLSNRHTKTYIRFSFRRQVVYLGFFLPCSTSTTPCVYPAPNVYSNNRKGCPLHKHSLFARPVHNCSTAFWLKKLPLPSSSKYHPKYDYKTHYHKHLSMSLDKEKVVENNPRHYYYKQRIF